MGAGPLDRARDAAARGDVVVLDEDGTPARLSRWFARSAAAHGVALEETQARRRLPGVGDAGRGPASERRRTCACARRCGGHALREIESDPLGHQDAPGAAWTRQPVRRPFDPRLPSGTRTSKRSAATDRSGRRRARRRGRRTETIGPRATPSAVARASASMHASVVTSPLARSSTRARSTIGSTSRIGRSWEIIGAENQHHHASTRQPHLRLLVARPEQQRYARRLRRHHSSSGAGNFGSPRSNPPARSSGQPRGGEYCE